MATTNDVTYVSFPITKTEETPEGHLLVYGKATDGSLDSDDQIVDPEWSGKALETWLATGGNVRVQHNAHRDPAGRGVQVDIDKDGDGGHWVKALVVEPTARELVKEKVLTAYSVGIMRPRIVSDTKARGGRIVDGEFGEVSLVDRPANRNCGITLVKAAKDGTPELIGEVFGDAEDALNKVAADGEDTVTKVAGDAGKSFSPADMAKLVEKKAKAEPDVVDTVVGDGRFADAVVDRLAAALKSTVAAEKRQVDPDVGGGVDRDKIPAQDFAGRDRSYPIVTPGDVSDAASSIGGAGADNYSADELKQRITAIARRKGPQFEAKLPASWKKAEDEQVVEVAEKGAKDCTGCGRNYDADSKLRNCEGCGNTLPTADKAAAPGPDTSAKAAKPVCTKCGMKVKKKARFCPGCGNQLAALGDGDSDVDKGATPADGVQDKDTKPVPGHREPDGPQAEIWEQDAGLQDGDAKTEGDSENTPTWEGQRRGQRSTKTVDYATARLHDALCSAYHPDVITDTYPSLKSVADAINVQALQDDAAALIGAGDLEAAQKALQVASAAQAIVKADPAAVADARAGLHKAFEGMYPTVRPTPTDMTPGRFKRPYVSAGHAPLSTDNAGSSRPAPIANQVDAGDFTRGYLGNGRADISPGAAKDNSPAQGGAAAYGAAQTALVRNAMTALHDHVVANRTELCPMAPTSAPLVAGPGDTGVIRPVTKTTDPGETPAEPALTVETVEKMLKAALAERDATIADLCAQVDELGAQPDPNLAPVRGVIATKSTTHGGAGVAERRSLVDEATQRERAKKLAYVQQMTKSSNPVMADQARTEEARMLAEITGNDRTH